MVMTLQIGIFKRNPPMAGLGDSCRVLQYQGTYVLPTKALVNASVFLARAEWLDVRSPQGERH